MGHGVSRVDDQVHHHLLQMDPIDPRGVERWGEVDREADIVAHDPPEHRRDRLDELVRLHDGDRRGAPAREEEQLTRQDGRAVARGLDAVYLLASIRVRPRRRLEEKIARRAGHGEQIVEVVRSPARELADGRELVSVAELHLGALPDGIVVASTHDVRDGDQEVPLVDRPRMARAPGRRKHPDATAAAPYVGASVGVEAEGCEEPSNRGGELFAERRTVTPVSSSNAATSAASAVVLIVEDDVAVRRATAMLLRHLGYRVEDTGSAEEAIVWLEREDPPRCDLVISDVSMPGMTGDQLAQLARSRWPDLPVLLMSGYHEDGLLDEEVRASVNLLHKPFTAESLQAAIATTLATHGGATRRA
jgi:CheY-like chemotaxis protein